MAKFLKYIIFVLLCLIGVISIFLSACYMMGPPPIDMEVTTTFYDQYDEPLESKTDQQTFSLDDVPSTVLTATVITEDRNFYSHYGFDFKGIIRAIWKNIKTHSLKEGASTLTQQYARNLYLTHERTWLRKIKEAFYTIQLEMHYSKEEILEGYLNTIYYGHGAYGVESASHYFFNKKADDLTLAESAMLAGIPKGPTYYSPLNDKERAEQRQKQILTVMKDEGVITEQEYITAENEVLTYTRAEESEESRDAPYFQDIAADEAAALLNVEEETIRSGRYHIYTTLDLDLQQKMDEELDDVIDAESEMEVGALSLDPETGAVRALAGGRDYETSPFNRAMDAR